MGHMEIPFGPPLRLSAGLTLEALVRIDPPPEGASTPYYIAGGSGAYARTYVRTHAHLLNAACALRPCTKHCIGRAVRCVVGATTPRSMATLGSGD